MQTPDAVMTQLTDICNNMHVEIDPLLSCVTHSKGRLIILVTLQTEPDCEESRRLMQSALLCELIEHFPEASSDVYVPRVKDGAADRPTVWACAQAECVRDWVIETHLILFQSILYRIANAYPWRGASFMIDSIPKLVQKFRLNPVTDGRTIVEYTIGIACACLLRPLESIVGYYDRLRLMADLTYHNKQRAPAHLLETYEIIHDIACKPLCYDSIAVINKVSNTVFVEHQQV